MSGAGNRAVRNACSFRKTTAARCACPSQVGCALECTFCSTGRQGFNRNLTMAEIIGQLWWANHAAAPHGGPGRGRRARDQQRGDDGHGRAAAEFRQRGDRAAADAGRPCLRPVAAARDGVDLRPGAGMDRLADDCPVALAVSLHAPERCVARPAGADQPQVSAARTDGGLPALSAVGAARFHHLRIRDAGRRERQPTRMRASWSSWCATCRASST